ncbi:hypothetical protein [Hominilimicola fabiformis]|uniref:Uncharacterized protein n=1 Tax=Hominilimicola fabiformis TaxID=2885356 RepID=A0AAE3J882_9FIRM|nr:hypothetical protein [Hominilimicola fabiformis]MCC2209197.1 hypothetical protein [Hominilimicola fabiformis]
MLYPFSYLIESPDHLTDKVVTVNNLSAVFEEGKGNIGVLLLHIAYKILGFC